MREEKKETKILSVVNLLVGIQEGDNKPWEREPEERLRRDKI